ncbi:MAG: RNA 3'-terminal phosphate cyclase [Candidatus Krumholzibacteriia bacterium]
MLTIDGSFGEGGGQILRSALALSLVTGREFRIERIRARRTRPGLLNQHLAAVMAAAAVGRAEVEHAEIGAQELIFHPGVVRPGDYTFRVGTAGSATLVLQTVLPALMTASGPSSLIAEGGTHNPQAPPFDFVAKVYLPLLRRFGPGVRAKLGRHGFYPAGGGRIHLTVEPVKTLCRLDLLERGDVRACRCKAVIANLPRHVAEREIRVLRRKLHLEPDSVRVEEVESQGPGNAVIVEVECAHVTEVYTGFGQKGVRAEIVAERVAKQVHRYLDAGVPVGEHLADQILLPMALAGGGAFVTLPLSLHARTNQEILKKFLGIEVEELPVSDTAVRVEVKHAL